MSVWLSLVLAAGITPGEMKELISQRLARLDKIVVELTTQVFVSPLHLSALDRERWKEYGIVRPHRLTLVRPGALDEDFTDDVEKGYVPVAWSVLDGRYVQRYVRPARDGYAHYAVCEGGQIPAAFEISPILQVFDIQMASARVPQFNLLRLFEEGNVTLVGAMGDVSFYRASKSMGGLQYQYECDVSNRGTPFRVKTTMIYPDPNLEPAGWEMFTLSTTEINGADFPMEAVVAVTNPNVNRLNWGVHYFKVTSVRRDEGLSTSAVRIEPVLRKSRVHIVGADGWDIRHTYDDQGNCVLTEKFGGPQTLAEHMRSAGRYLRAQPHVAGLWVAGIAGAAFLVRQVGRRRATAACVSAPAGGANGE